MNLEKVPVSYLSLLPLKERDELLWRLPIADLCLLENTEYVEGFRTWQLTGNYRAGNSMAIPIGDPDIGRYLEEWDSAAYEKAILYSQGVVAVIGCRDPFGELLFYLPFEDELPPHNQGMMMIPVDDRGLVISPLYAVRKPRDSDGDYELSFLPRYHEMNEIA
ncbi:MAG: hypothetical protein MJE68_33485 [Proteobacteria bacterium]|nr:hypothetical protein [Pseudomonadota bacterium]